MNLATKINAHITRSKKLYVAGNRLTRSQFVNATKHLFPNLVGRNPDLTTDTYAFISAYTKLNKFLAHRGLQIRSHKLKAFTITNLDQSLTKVARLRAKSAHISTAANTLEVGSRIHSAVWSPLDSATVERISGHLYTRITTPSYGK